MTEVIDYDDFRGTMNSLIGGQARPKFLKERGAGSPRNAAEYSEAYEEMCDLISNNFSFWTKYLEDNADNTFIQNIELPF